MLVSMLTGASAALAWSTTHVAPDQYRPAAAVPVAVGVPVARVQTLTGPSPVRIVIPTIAVGADVERLHRGVNGTLNTPVQWNDAGWYADGVVPGDRGPAVIVGHLDSARDGPAVFYRLPQLLPGDDVLVETSDGRTQRFVVDTTRKFAKTEFPTAFVYGPTTQPELRLITCTGSFDKAAHSYRDNLIVTAHSV